MATPFIITMRKQDKLLATEEVVIKDIIREHAHRTGMTVAESDEAVRTVFDIIKMHLFERHNVRIPRFGTFHLQYQKGQLCRLPQKAKTFLTPRIIPRFRFCTSFKQLMATIDLSNIHTEETGDSNDLPTGD